MNGCSTVALKAALTGLSGVSLTQSPGSTTACDGSGQARLPGMGQEGSLDLQTFLQSSHQHLEGHGERATVVIWGKLWLETSSLGQQAMRDKSPELTFDL